MLVVGSKKNRIHARLINKVYENNKDKQVHFQLGRYFYVDGNLSVKTTLNAENSDKNYSKKITQQIRHLWRLLKILIKYSE